MEHLNIRATLNQDNLDNKVRRALDYCASNNVLFADKQFPASLSSLVGIPRHPEYRGQWDNLQWSRCKDIFGAGKYEIFRDVDPTDIRQGALGDCYFLCSLASLAEQPSLIKRLFDLQTVNVNGVLGVWLHINGSWRLYALDEYFPYDANRRGLAFSRSVGNELWVIALEKAYAKAYGSYFDIVGGDPVHALSDLTGSPYDRIEDFSDLKAAWTKLKDANSKNYVITCFTKQGKTTEEQNKEGLVSGHAYSILDVREVVDASGAPRFIVQVRNPWGRFEWNGEFSDNSPAWHPRIKKELKVEVSDDGLFWMPFERFIQYFEGIGIVKVMPGFVSNGVPVQLGAGVNKSIFRLTLAREGEVTISLNQVDSKTVDNQRYQYSYFRMTLGRINGDQLEMVDDALSPERNIFMERTMAAGEYILLVEAYWCSNLVTSFAVGTYGMVHVDIQPVEDIDSLFAATEAELWRNFALRNPQKLTKMGTRSARDGGLEARLDTSKLQSKDKGFTLYSYFNNSSTHSIQDTVKFAQLVGFNVCGRQAGPQSAQLVMAPQSNDILLFKMDPRQNSYALSQQVIQERLVPAGSAPNQQLYNLLQRLRGPPQQAKVQDPSTITNEQQRAKAERLARERAAEEQARLQLVEQQKQLAAEKKRKQDENLMQQLELFSLMNGNRPDRVEDHTGLMGLIVPIFGGFIVPGKVPNQRGEYEPNFGNLFADFK